MVVKKYLLAKGYFSNTSNSAMLCHYSMLFKETGSRYISWNILFLWGLVLWVALCASNIYYSGMLNQEASLFYLQDLNFGITYNISAKPEAIENMLEIATTNCSLYKGIQMLKAVLQYIYVLVSVPFVIFFIYSHEYLKRTLQIWNDMMCNIRLVVDYLTTLARRNIFSRITNKNDCTILQSKVIASREINAECLESKVNSNIKDRCTLDKKVNINIYNIRANIVKSEIIFSSYTLLLFNNCELYHYFNHRHLKSTLFSKYLVDQSSKYIGCELSLSNKYKRDIVPSSKRDAKKGIVSSAPEFKKFLILHRSRFFYPYMLEVSTSYTIRIQSIYKVISQIPS